MEELSEIGKFFKRLDVVLTAALCGYADVYAEPCVQSLAETFCMEEV